MTSEEFWQRIETVMVEARAAGLSDDEMLTELDGIAEGLREAILEAKGED